MPDLPLPRFAVLTYDADREDWSVWSLHATPELARMALDIARNKGHDEARVLGLTDIGCVDHHGIIESFEALRAAGGSAWDAVDDPAALLERD